MEIKVNPLSHTSVKKAYDMLVNYKRSLEEFPMALTKALSERFNEILEIQAPSAAQGKWRFYVTQESSLVTGEGGEIIGSEKGGAVGVFIFDGEVEFIEFGTDVVGLNNHGGINDEWLSKLPEPYNKGYDTGPSIVHFEDQNQDFWVYYDEAGRHWTQGVPADPFIYRSVKQLLDERARIARVVFKKENVPEGYYFM